MNYFNNINLNQNELQKAVMHPLAQAPLDPKQGQMYFNTGNKKLYYYDSTKWVALNDIDLSNYVTTTQLNNGLNEKLDKKTTYGSVTQVYAVQGNTQKMIDATSAATINTVVLRDADGKLQVAAGVNDADAVNKSQMDTAIAAAVEAGVSGLEDTSNKVDTITDPGSDTQYPNTKAVVNYVKSQVSKVKDVTLDGTSIVNTETGIVALESTPYIELSGTNGNVSPEQYENLSGDKQSYIILTYTGYPYRLPYVANDDGGLIYSTIIRPRANSKTSLSKLTVYIKNGSQPTWEASETPVVTSAGGTIDGNVTIGGNLTVQGTTTTVESETLKVKDQLIEVASGNTAKLDSPAGLIVPKYDGTDNVALVFDNTGTAYVGDAVLDSDGLIDMTATGTKLVALAGRAKTIAGDNLVKWDNTNKIFVDAGIAASNLATTDDIPTASDYLTSTSAEQVISNGVNKKLGESSDFKIQLVKTSAFKITDSTNSDNLLFSVVRGPNNMASPSRVCINAPLAIGSNTTAVGTAGQVLTSQGDGKAPIWKAIPAPSNMVTTDTSQTITKLKIFEGGVAFDAQIILGGSSGTAGQVLTSQGANKAPQWTTIVKKFVKDFPGNNTDLEFSFEHKLGTNQCTVSLYKLNDSSNYEMVMADIILTTTNVIIKFAQAPAPTDSFRVVVTG